jgi:aminoglycoside phosphotransferase (APT) family kinase protein
MFRTKSTRHRCLIFLNRWREAVHTLAKLHRVNLKDVSLDDYGRPKAFYQRQLKTWIELANTQGATVNVETRKSVGPVPGMEVMVSFFFDENYRPRDRATLIHGDYKIDNLVFHKTEPKIIGVLE